MVIDNDIAVETLRRYNVEAGKSSVSGLSSGAFMTVQLHLAHSSSFVGAGVIAGGPYRCAESYRDASPLTEDACELTAIQLCMNPLIPQNAPNGQRLAELARRTSAAGKIDDVKNIADDRLYIFTGSQDKVVNSMVVAQTRRFYECLGVPAANIAYVDTVPAGHSIITNNPEDSPLDANQPPYINNGGFIQSHDILNHIYPGLKPPSQRLTGRMVRFDQTEFFGNDSRASMSSYGYAYIPREVEDGAPARVHIAMHGCKQGYRFVDYVYGRLDAVNRAPYGNRYFMTTGYSEIADSNNIIVLYPQAQGADGGDTQNPDGCWDWWGYTCANPEQLDYYSREAIQIKAIHGMLTRLGG